MMKNYSQQYFLRQLYYLFSSANTAPQTEQVQYNRKKQKAFGLMYVQPRNLTQVILQDAVNNIPH